MDDRSVALFPNGNILIGDYNGYRCVDEASIYKHGEPEVYHHACWKLAGNPFDFTQASEGSDDQGYFFDEGAHDLREQVHSNNPWGLCVKAAPETEDLPE